MKAHVGVELQLHAFLTSARDGSEWSTSLSNRLTPAKSAHWYLRNRHWMGARAGLDDMNYRQISTPARNKIRISHSSARWPRHYNDSAIMAPRPSETIPKRHDCQHANELRISHIPRRAHGRWADRDSLRTENISESTCSVSTAVKVLHHTDSRLPGALLLYDDS
jgi:hypothetical protein